MATATDVLHVKAAAFDQVSERLAERIFNKLIRGDFNESLALMLQEHGWTCIPPAAKKPRVRRKRR